jgi:hypothetical protein
MATSGSVDFNQTATDVISSAYELARVKDPIENLTTDQENRGRQSLNKIIKYLQKNGMPLWAIKRDSITLIESSQSYTCGSGGTGLSERPLRILEAFYRDTDNDTQIEIISRSDYNTLGDKSSEGIPTQIYYDPQLTQGVLYVYNPADATTAGNTLHLVYHRPFEDMDALSDDFDFPQEWYLALEYNLAVDIALRNGIRPNRVGQLEAKAKEYLFEVTWWDEENVATQLQPDDR